MSSELKPLYALLRRLNIADYLIDNEFQNSLIELDLDEEWHEIAREYELDGLSGRSDYHEPFFELMQQLDDGYSFTNENQKKLIKLLLGFLRWSPTEIDYQPIYQELKKLEYEKSVLKMFLDQSKSISTKNLSRLSPSRDIINPKRNSKKVFIIHGHDQVALLELQNLLKEEFDLQPVVLKDNPSAGLRTIISKFEEAISDCEITIALFTPDDMTISNHARARQNVILELGYALGRDFGKLDRKIIIIKKGQVETPSDIAGILYFEYLQSIQELHLKLRDQLAVWKK